MFTPFTYYININFITVTLHFDNKTVTVAQHFVWDKLFIHVIQQDGLKYKTFQKLGLFM